MTDSHAASLGLCVCAAAVALLCGLLGACTRKAADAAAPSPAASAASEAQEAPASASLKREALMQLVVPGWQNLDGRPRTADVTLHGLDKMRQPIPGSDKDALAEMSPLEVVRLDATHALMLTENTEVAEDGRRFAGHADGAWLGAYFFERQASGWTLAGREDGVDYQGFMGMLGSTQIDRIQPGRFVMRLVHGSCWQGYCGDWLSVYNLGPSSVKPLISGIRLSADNQNAVGDCDEPQKDDEGDAKLDECYAIKGTPTIVVGTEKEPGELRIHFTGKHRANESRRVETVDDTAVYTLRKDTLVQTQGRNPVPGF